MLSVFVAPAERVYEIAATYFYTVPTPSAALIDAGAVIGGAFDFMPVITSALGLFVVAALGWKYGGRVLSWVLRFGQR